MKKIRSERNQTMTLTAEEVKRFSNKLISVSNNAISGDITNKILMSDTLAALELLPDAFVDLMIIDPPYNLQKNFGEVKFRETNNADYVSYLMEWFPKVIRLLKPNASVYVCCDWKSSPAIFEVMSKYLIVQNRITWEREKGRGAKSNWKNSCEDIWFGTVSKNYYFNVDAVKIKKKVIAPYKIDGKPKDWDETEEGNFRTTFPSNFWNDITIPYWSMPENTDHPTQKPEKLIAKLILASSEAGAMVFDPFLGSGTTAVVAKKLNRNYCGIELNKEYCCLCEKRLEYADTNKRIQGYENGIFWERNMLSEMSRKDNTTKSK